MWVLVALGFRLGCLRFSGLMLASTEAACVEWHQLRAKWQCCKKGADNV